MTNIPKEQLFKMIEAGIQAPSADNCQPWKFKLLDNGFELWLDQLNMGLFFDVKHVATQISCGALIENVETLAKALGLSVQIDYFNKSVDAIEGKSKFAQLKFSIAAKQVEVEEVSHVILNRHSNRNLFQFYKVIPAELMTELCDIVKSGGHFLQVYKTPKSKKSIIQTITAIDTIRFVHERIHHDFYRVLRFSKTAKQARDGLAAATLGIESFMLPILEALSPWKLTKFFNYFGLHHVMAFRGTWLPMKASSEIVAIVHKGAANYVESGCIMQRFWLLANKNGLDVQALGALPLFLARVHLVGGEGFTSTQLTKLSMLEEGFSNITQEYNKNEDQVIMLFRLGYGKKQAVRAYRRSIKSFLL